jgi:hypothetical protein
MCCGAIEVLEEAHMAVFTARVKESTTVLFKKSMLRTVILNETRGPSAEDGGIGVGCTGAPGTVTFPDAFTSD